MPLHELPDVVGFAPAEQRFEFHRRHFRRGETETSPLQRQDQLVAFEQIEFGAELQELFPQRCRSSRQIYVYVSQSADYHEYPSCSLFPVNLWSDSLSVAPGFAPFQPRV